MRGEEGEEGKTAGADFIVRLFRMLEDRSHHSVVAWSASGETFAVKVRAFSRFKAIIQFMQSQDMNVFCKTILPKHFKHSNFASFVSLSSFYTSKTKRSRSGNLTSTIFIRLKIQIAQRLAYMEIM